MNGGLSGFGVQGNVPFEHKSEQKAENPTEPQTKAIAIDWDNIPPHVIIPKLQKALRYQYSGTEKKGVFDVIENRSSVSAFAPLYQTTLNSCICENWLWEGSSLNPCKHMVRVKYTDKEIHELLKKLGVEHTLDIAGELPTKRIKNTIPQPDLIIQSLTPRLAEVGKIKIGGKSEKKTGRGFLLPEKYDHFEIATLMKDAEGRLVMDDEMNKVIGEGCKALDIYLCYDDPTMNMPTFYSWFVKSKLVCMGNGEKAMRTQEDGSKKECECNPKLCVAYKEKRCKPYGRLSVILASANRIGGTYIFRTTSWNTIRNVLSSMAFIRTITGGVLAGIPLRMTLLPMTVNPHDVGHNVKIYVVNIEFSGKMDDLKQSAAIEVERRMQLGMNMKSIEAADTGFIKSHVVEEAEEEADDIAGEFAPEGEQK